jgi:predicted permease
VILDDLRHAFRMMAAKPAFTSLAVASLALGIGANTAIFSLWNSVLHASLPGAANPGELVILTNPASSGLWRGTWNTTTDGPRSWVTYAEFEQLRDRASGFSALMASQSSLNTWQVRVGGGPPEEMHGRLVSGTFFEALGVRPAVGRLFTPAEDRDASPYAVISHAYWQRRFGGRLDALGQMLTFGDTIVTVVGIASPGFAGETAGQLPDVWLPLRLQPRLLPGGNWLTEAPPDKVMWLHVFGRLRPGVSLTQAEAQANAILQTSLESFYGAAGGERRRELLDQHLRLHPGGRGVSSTVEQFSASLTVLFAAVGILLLIGCANLANLLLARSVGRQGEFAIRVSLGAARVRLVRQLVTESLALAAVGGLAAMGVAHLLHGALVQLLQQADSRFSVSFGVDIPVLLFAATATVAAALLIGMVPALQLTRIDAASRLQEIGRGAMGSMRESRSIRWLVGAQLTLSLPMLIAAGLLVQTVSNLQNPELGFRPARLLLARINLGAAATDTGRRDRILQELQSRLAQIPGVESATFSQLGLFGGGVSTDGVVVEGSALTAERARESALDRVGAAYFTTLGIPVRTGRDIASSDRAGSHKVCVVNEAFVRRFFGERSPLGLHVITGVEDGTSYEVVGVVADARTQSLRDAIEPRFYVPAEQRSSTAVGRTFLIRTSAAARMSVPAAVREAVTRADSAVSLSEIEWLEERLADLTAEDRAVARLAAAFGVLAMALAVIGLNGVMSYGVSRRSTEIAIRIALGARAGRVIAMILGENIRLILAGLAAGGVLSYFGPPLVARSDFGSRLLDTRLHGVTAQDPLTLTAGVTVLLLAALAAAYLPARRASRVDPMMALHHER